jgi:hypothetical protein
MNWYLFKLDLWRRQRSIEHCHQWFDRLLRDRFDDAPCRNCEIPEGMDW